MLQDKLKKNIQSEIQNIYHTFFILDKKDEICIKENFFLSANLSLYNLIENKNSIFQKDFFSLSISEKYLFYSKEKNPCIKQIKAKNSYYFINLYELKSLSEKQIYSFLKAKLSFQDSNLNSFLSYLKNINEPLFVKKKKLKRFISFIKRNKFHSLYVFHNGKQKSSLKNNIALVFPLLHQEYVLLNIYAEFFYKTIKKNFFSGQLFYGKKNLKNFSAMKFDVLKDNLFYSYRCLLNKFRFYKKNSTGFTLYSGLEIFKIGIMESVFGQVLYSKDSFLSKSTKYYIPQFYRRELYAQLLNTKFPSKALLLWQKNDFLKYNFNELYKCRGLSQNRFHKYDIFYHSIYAADFSYGFSLAVRFAALFHDLGKVATRKVKADGEASFHAHEYVSAKLTKKILQRWNFPVDFRKKVEFLVLKHMFHYTDDWTDKAVRRFIQRVDVDTFEELLQLRSADRRASGKSSKMPKIVERFREHIHKIREKEKEFTIKDLQINGEKIMKECKLKPGVLVGKILHHLLNEVKSGNLENREDVLLTKALDYKNSLAEESLLV